MADIEKSAMERPSLGVSRSSLSHEKGEILHASSASKHDVKRLFSTLSVICMSFNVVSVVPSIASVLVFSIPGGGTHGMIWAWLVCSVFLTVISLAIAEAASATSIAATSRTSNVTLHYSPSRSENVPSWIAGYATTIGNSANVASIAWACALQIMAGAIIGSEFMFMPSTAQTYGVFCGVLILQGLACGLKPTILSQIQTPFLILSLLLWISLIITLPTTSDLNTEKFVFGTFTNVNEAWSDNVFAFLLTFLSPFWVIGRATSTAHIGEEAQNLKTVPFAIVISTVATAVMALALEIVLAFCMGNDLRAVLFSQSGEPLATILLNSFGAKGMLAAWSFIIVLQFNMGLTMLTNSSRQISAFSKNGAFNYGIFSKHLAGTSQTFNTSIAATLLPIILSMLLGLLAFAGTNAVCRTLFSTAVVSQFMAHTITIVQSRLRSEKGSFSLGVLSLPVATASSIVMVVMSVILVFPDTEHPTGGTMNYTVAILGGTILLSFADLYFAKTRKGGAAQ